MHMKTAPLHQISHRLYLPCAAKLAEHRSVLAEVIRKVRNKTFVHFGPEGAAQKGASGLILHVCRQFMPFGERHIGEVSRNDVEASLCLYAREQVGADIADSVLHSQAGRVAACNE